MNESKGRLGLLLGQKEQLFERFADQLGPNARKAAPVPPASQPEAKAPLGHADAREQMALMRRAGEAFGLENPFFRLTEGLPTPWSEVDGRRVLNFSAYNYLGLNGDPRVSEAAKAATDRYGTSVSGSRITSGDRSIHRQLEAALASLYDAEDALTLVGGHATNVTVIAHLVGPGDGVVYDALAHNSIIQGAQLSGALRRSFAHNDLTDLERVLQELVRTTRRRLIVVEGCYGMDGDAPDLGRLLDLAGRYGAHVMVDEAHALGVLGARGYGLAEHCGVDPTRVDLWMGTLSKTLASCGGYVAGRSDLIDYLRTSVPGFLFSVGMPSAVAAAALAALNLMKQEPERVRRLQSRGQVFMSTAQSLGLNTGASLGAAIIPIIIGSSLRTILVSTRLWNEGIWAQPILYPGVPERSARLRFFVTSEHEPEDLRHAARATARALAEITVDPAQLKAFAARTRS